MNSSISSSTGSSTVDKKRRFAEERAERLRDPRQRHMGIDRAALDEQVRERAALEQLEKERNAFFDRQALEMDKHAQVLHAEVSDIRARRAKEVEAYRATFQKKDAAREWDLNDPQRVTTDIPARVHDVDPRNGASGLQKFEGEDLDFKERRKAQQAQQRDWAQQQTDEKLVKKWMEQEANRTYEDRSEEVNYRTYQIERNIADQRRQVAVNLAEFNKALAAQKRREQMKDKNYETQKNLEEIHNMLHSDFLNEHEGTMSTLGEATKAERFKGLTDSQRERIASEQSWQRDEAQARRQQEAEDERQWAQQEVMQNRVADALDRQRQRERRAEAAKLAEEQKQQAAAAAAKKRNTNALYSNQVDEDYYKHWGLCK